MSTLTIRKTWNVNGTLTNVASMTLGIVRDDTGAAVVAPGTAMSLVGTGVYEYTLSPADGGTTYTATIVATYSGQTYTFIVNAAPDVTPDASAVYPDSLVTVLNQLTALLLQITLSPKPTYSVHGHSYSWTEYQQMLTKQMEQVTKLIAQANPFEIVSRG
jgi:hypothetical protein